MSQTLPTIYFGTTTFGSSYVPPLQDPEIASKFLDVVREKGITSLDTAALYPLDNHGGSERMLGAVEAAKKGFTINTKVLFTGQSSDGTLSRHAVRLSVGNSLRNLGVEKVGILYAHVPDYITPLEEQAEALHEQYQNGYCEKIGVSNFPVEMLEEFIAICERKGFIKPSVYQGQYNLICRGPEKELLPFLRRHNMTFIAYSPLGGGFFTGKLTLGQAEGTRLGSAYGAHFAKWYNKPEFHDALRKLLSVLTPRKMTTTEVALRWLVYHSEITKEDGIILGATKAEQIVKNMEDIWKGPLPEDIVNEITSIGRILEVSGAADAKHFEVRPAIVPNV